ncbi:non-canonical purine NTP pyrophosphatase [Pseudomonas aeruginosa]
MTSRTAPALTEFVIVTSNPTKVSEIYRIAGDLILIDNGPDLEEVLGTPDEVIIHKALAAGEGRMVEDAILVIDGEPHVDVRWKVKALRAGEYQTGLPIVWEVRLGVLLRGVVFTYVGRTKGTICPFDCDGFGIDPIFLVDSAKRSLAALEQSGEKDTYSARARALQQVIKGEPYDQVEASKVEPWTGAYQGV